MTSTTSPRDLIEILDYTDLPPHPLGPYRRRPSGAPRRLPEIAPSARGGSVTVTSRLALLEYSPDYPGVGVSNRVAHSRLVLECKLGRLLDDTEIAFHLNGVTWDNRPDNLRVMHRREFDREHVSTLNARPAIVFTDDEVRDALDGRTVDQAAKLLGISRMTMYRKYRTLIAERRTSSLSG